MIIVILTIRTSLINCITAQQIQKLSNKNRMERLLRLEKELVNAPKIDAHQFKLTVFGPNYPERDNGFEILRKNNMLHHYHITESSKEQVRYQTFLNSIKARSCYNRTIEETDDDPNPASLYSNSLVFYDLGFSVRSGVHYFLYSKAIKLLGTDKHETLLRRAFELKDMGCFGLTELAHGSNVKGILTEAHYDHENKEFVMHTPSKQGMKFWIGGAAHTANMAVIWAQLYIDGKKYGVHAYVVPIRDPQTHKLLPGVLIGDCGPKNGLNGIDNGFIILDKVRIPKMNQLDRISGVDENGKFRTIIANDDKRFGLHLSALSGGRYMISTNCCGIATQALTIGIRYTTERRQFKIGNSKQEALLFDYPLTKRRMMPLLAQNLTYYVAAMKYVTQWDNNQKNILEPSHPMIEKLHAISSVMKAKTSWFAAQCTREAREMLGGNGFSSYSKLGTLYNDNDINLTWEGDNHVLIQQTTKYVLEEVQKVLQKGKKTNNDLLKFVENPPDELIPFTRDSLKCLQQGLKFLQFKLLRKIEETGLNMLELKQKGMPIMDIWNNSQVFLGRDIALTYGDIAILTTMIESIKTIKNPTNKHVFETATRLWLLSIYRKDEFVELKHHPLLESLISEQAQLLAEHSLEILKLISTDDDIIGSPFADPNGRGIEKYLKLVMSKPANHRPEWWETLITR